MQVLRVLARAYAPPEGLDALVAFYEQVFGEPCKVRLSLPTLGLEVASVGAMHLIAGSEEKLKPFRAAQATFWVDSVAEAEKELRRLGAGVLLGPEHESGGSYMIARHPDGLVVEYLDQAG